MLQLKRAPFRQLRKLGTIDRLKAWDGLVLENIGCDDFVESGCTSEDQPGDGTEKRSQGQCCKGPDGEDASSPIRTLGIDTEPSEKRPEAELNDLQIDQRPPFGKLMQDALLYRPIP